MSDQQTDVRARPLVHVSAFATDSRFRLVHLEGVGWAPMSAHEFESRVSAAFPRLDPRDPVHVRWQDRPWQWPR